MSEILQSEDIKLYEYNQYKPELDDEIIEHFGILGMHWGQRNGPPYPLGSDKSTGRRLKKSAGGGSGSGSVKRTRKQKRALKKARKARAKNLKIKTLEKQKQQQLEKSKEEIIKKKDIKSMLRNEIGRAHV